MGILGFFLLAVLLDLVTKYREGAIAREKSIKDGGTDLPWYANRRVYLFSGILITSIVLMVIVEFLFHT